MRIDAYTHFFPKTFFDKLVEIAGDYKDIGKRVRGAAGIVRPRPSQEDRRHVSRTMRRSSPIRMPPLELLAKRRRDRRATARLINDGFAEHLREGARPFPGLGRAGVARRGPTPARAKRNARSRIGALGVQIYTNVAGKPLDRRNTSRSGRR